MSEDSLFLGGAWLLPALGSCGTPVRQAASLCLWTGGAIPRIRWSSEKMKLSRVRCVLLLVVLVDCTVFAARSKPKAKREKYAIAFDNPYYTSRFELCKKLRIFNPVETFKAQRFAATIFRKCGPKMVVRLGSKYNFPAYGKNLSSYTVWGRIPGNSELSFYTRP